MNAVDQKTINRFWTWFKAESSELASLLDTSQTIEIAERVGSEVERLSKGIGWELGPGLKRDYSFTITFNGQRDRIPLVERIVAFAPDLKRWEINCGRPPKVWDGRFVLRNRFGESIEVNSGEWSYTLVAFDSNSFFDVKLIGSLPAMDEAAKIQACDIVVQAELGERERLEWIDKIEITQEPRKSQLDNATPIKYLRKHIESLLEA